MNEKLLAAIADEIRRKLSTRHFGKIYQLGPLSFAIDFGSRDGFLFISAEPANPRMYLIQRRVKQLEKESVQLSFFGNAMRSQLGRGELLTIEKDFFDRIVRLSFRVEDDIGERHFRHLIVQLTGRAANLYILDELGRIMFALRPPKGAGQQIGERYLPPRKTEKNSEKGVPINEYTSAAADAYFTAIATENTFQSKAAAARSRLKKLRTQKHRLRKNLKNDLSTYGDPESHQKLGNLLLANVATAVRQGNRATIIDYYSEGEPKLDINVDESSSLQDEAARQFKEYTRSKRAIGEITTRLTTLDAELQQLAQQEDQLENIIAQRDEKALEAFAQPKTVMTRSGGKSESANIPGIRRYLSTDGYEVWVGRGARDNDQLTFRHARPNDLWLHAGDYPGSHVVVRNPYRKEVPHRTMIEAAQLAAHFSQANEDSKVVVHYTQRKFLSKPKGAAPGLVRMSNFRSITVAPQESIPRI